MPAWHGSRVLGLRVVGFRALVKVLGSVLGFRVLGFRVADFRVYGVKRFEGFRVQG